MNRIAIVGCGVIGVTTALKIQNHFKSSATITIFTETTSPYTTSDVAAGLWTPFYLYNTDMKKVTKWAKDTQDFFLKLWKNGQCKETGICLQHIVNLSDSENYKMPEWVQQTLGYQELSHEQISYYKNLYNEEFTGGYTFASFICEPSKLLPFLQAELVKFGVRIEKKKINDLSELADFDVVVNCSGLNARSLVPDPLVKSVRGHITRVSAPWQFHTLLMHTASGHYIIPNPNFVVLGGTYQVDNFDLNANDEDKTKIMNGCCSYYPSLRNAHYIEDCVGLRPSRIEVRLEVEKRNIDDKILNIVHNYGHGGSGVTLSIGCAKTATELVIEVLNRRTKHKL